MAREDAYKRINDAFWGQWLPKTNYVSIIDHDYNAGYASIELWEPVAVTASDFDLTIWVPIKEKE